MRHFSLACICLGFGLASTVMSTLAAGASGFAPPATPSRPVVDVVHGVKLTDPYRWLENGRDPEVEAWTRRQHETTVSWLDANAPAVTGLHDELVAYFDRDITQPPFFKKGREFFYRTRKGEAQAKVYTRIDGREQLIFDPLALDPSGKTSVGAFVLNRDASKAAVATYSRGSEITDFRVIDTRTGEQIGRLLPGIQSFAWPHDERYAFISPRTKESIERQEPQRCYRHKLGDDHNNDELLIAMTDAKDYCSVFEPEDAELTVFETGDFYSNTLKIRPIGSTSEPKTIYSSKEFRATPDFRKDRIYIVTNDHAPNFKLMVASYQAPEFERWQVLWPEQDTVLDGVDVTSDWLLVRDKKDVLTRVWVHDLQGRRVRELPLPELGNISASAYDKDKNVVYATLSTFTAPGRLYEIDGKKLAWSLIWEDTPPLDTSQIESKLVFYSSKDGTRVPMFLTYRKGTKQDGTNPVFLHGYGGFNIGIGPDYVRSWATFINRGGVLAEAGIRGGDEYGERWHEAAKFDKKQNSLFHCGRRMAGAREVHDARSADGGRRQQRRLARRRDAHPAAGPVYRGAVPGAAHRHGAVSQVPDRALLDSRIRRSGQGRGFRVYPALLAVREHPRRREFSAYARHRGRIRFTRRSHARQEVRGRSAESSRPDRSVPAVHGLRQRARLRQGEGTDHSRPRVRASLHLREAGHALAVSL